LNLYARPEYNLFAVLHGDRRFRSEVRQVRR
jgi:hypothetical protein